jgi:hypothetical protein
MSRPTYYQHRTISAVAKILHDTYHAEGGLQLLRAAARIRVEIAGTGHDENRVALAIEREGWVATTVVVLEIIAAVQDAADLK